MLHNVGARTDNLHQIDVQETKKTSSKELVWLFYEQTISGCCVKWGTVRDTPLVLAAATGI